MGNYIEKSIILYNSKKDLPNPPSYMKDLKRLIEINSFLDGYGYGDLDCLD